MIYISIKNDLSFLLDSELNLYEHQSTFNPNMPFRGLLYMAQLYHRQLYEKNLYGSTLIKIPAPQYIVFYNGTEEHPDKQYLKLSDAFEKPVKDGWYEWTTIMYNINEGHNEGLMQACKALKDYATYVAMVRKYYEKLHNLREAIDCALSEAIDKNLLDVFLADINRRFL